MTTANAIDGDYHQDAEGHIRSRDGRLYELFAVDEVERLRADVARLEGELAALRDRFDWVDLRDVEIARDRGGDDFDDEDADEWAVTVWVAGRARTSYGPTLVEAIGRAMERERGGGLAMTDAEHPRRIDPRPEAADFREFMIAAIPREVLMAELIRQNDEITRLTAELAVERSRFDWAMDAANCLWRWPEDAAGAGERWSAAAGDEAAVTAGDPRAAIDGAMAGRAPDGGIAP